MHLHQVCGLYKLGGAENTLKCRKLNRVEEEWSDRILEVQQGQMQSFATQTDQPQVTIQAGHELVKKTKPSLQKEFWGSCWTAS